MMKDIDSLRPWNIPSLSEVAEKVVIMTSDNRMRTCNRYMIALKDGRELREWVEEQIVTVRPAVIRCATYTLRPLGVRWLARLSRRMEATVKILCDRKQNHVELTQCIEELFPDNKETLRFAPAMPGYTADVFGLFHPKFVILDEVTAVVGSTNLSGQALGIGRKPHNIEVSIGLSGPHSRETISQLVQYFDEWWENSSTLSHLNSNKSMESNTMSNPEYVLLQDRPGWGIAAVQTEGAGLFGQEQWLAASDITPLNLESHPARFRAADQFVESMKPQPWEPPAVQIAKLDSATIQYRKEHFFRLAGYWLQAENRQGQLDSLPVLQLRHQTSLVEYLSRPDAPREVLIADEVGLGKTVEIGLLLSRLRSANPKLRILYITTGGLVTNVYDELRNMGIDDLWVFGNSSLDDQHYPLARLGRKEHDNWVVASLHRLGHGSNATKKLKDTMWDVVIADECHRLRMYGSGDNQNPQKWYRVVEQIVNEHLSKEGRVYFLSGTPHQGNREVFFNLSPYHT